MSRTELHTAPTLPLGQRVIVRSESVFSDGMTFNVFHLGALVGVTDTWVELHSARRFFRSDAPKQTPQALNGNGIFLDIAKHGLNLRDGHAVISEKVVSIIINEWREIAACAEEAEFPD